MSEFRYTEEKEGEAKYVNIEGLGRFELNPGENAKDKVKAVAAVLRNLKEDDVQPKKVKDLGGGVVTTDELK